MTAEEIRIQTRHDLDVKLKKYKKCCLIRPTGFGKTWTLTGLIKDYNRVLYVAPTAAIMNTVVDVYYTDADDVADYETVELAKELRSFDHVDMMTYMKIQSLGGEEIDDLPDYDLICFDEAHVMGAQGASVAIEKIFDRFRDSDIIGATATPNRMDGFDIVGTFFDNIVVFPYTLHDAFQDRLLQVPNYYYCTFDIDSIKDIANKDASKQLFAAGIDKETIKSNKVQKLINASILYNSKLLNIDNIIRSGVEKYAKGPYYKFICFFNDVTKMNDKGDEVKQWFQDAFPDYSVSVLDIHSRDAKKSDNVNRLDNLKAKDKHIDLIFCVNMINVGYHVNDLTGILMYRCTQSNIIYIQQLGRGLSSGSDSSCLVFDVVDNLHRRALYSMKPPKRISSNGVAGYGYGSRVADVGEIIGILPEEDQIKYKDKSLKCRIEKHNDRYVVLAYNEHYDRAADEIATSWWVDANNIRKEDIKADGFEATYRELIAKAVAEPISYLCREAVGLHFKRWCRDNNIPYPITMKDLETEYGIPEEAWRNEFSKALSVNGLNYPWQDSKKIMDCASVPLDVFAREKKVSVPRILELLGVS